MKVKPSQSAPEPVQRGEFCILPSLISCAAYIGMAQVITQWIKKACQSVCQNLRAALHSSIDPRARGGKKSERPAHLAV